MAKKSNTQAPVLLGTPAVRQILARLSKSEKEENALVQKVKIMHINWEISQYILFSISSCYYQLIVILPNSD